MRIFRTGFSMEFNFCSSPLKCKWKWKMCFGILVDTNYFILCCSLFFVCKSIFHKLLKIFLVNRFFYYYFIENTIDIFSYWLSQGLGFLCNDISLIIEIMINLLARL